MPRAGNIIHAKILIHNDDGKIKFHNLSFALISREALLEQPWRESVLIIVCQSVRSVHSISSSCAYKHILAQNPARAQVTR